MNVRRLPIPIEYLTGLLKDKKPFAFSRYGDGEFACILGEDGENCDGHKYFPEMGKELAETLKTQERPKDGSRPYIRAIGPMALRTRERQIERFINKSIPNWNSAFYDADVLLSASLNSRLRPFLDALRSHSIIYVGPEHLSTLPRSFFPRQAIVYTPLTNCFLHLDQLKFQLSLALKEYPCTLVGLSCGPVANILLDWLYREASPALTLIDFGSLWDVYCGVRSRSYSRRMSDEQIAALARGNGAS